MIKKTLILCYVLLLTAFLLPLLIKRSGETAEEKPEETVMTEKERQISVLHQGAVIGMDMHSYLVGVTAAEMPASFPMEALKAQAVAARSYAAYCAAANRHKEAWLCTEPGCCQAWMDESAMRERWGEEYEKYYGRIAAAVADTAGQELRYHGEPVLAAFHASSPGFTEASGSIWNETPYLISVSSPETVENLPQLISSQRVAALDFRDAVLSVYPQAVLGEDCSAWVEEIRRRESGRVEQIRIGGVSIPGSTMRNLFSLRSTAFDLQAEGDVMVFTVQGYGHGVGMSQQGARLMAEAGSPYQAILLHYYPGTALVS